MQANKSQLCHKTEGLQCPPPPARHLLPSLPSLPSHKVRPNQNFKTGDVVNKHDKHNPNNSTFPAHFGRHRSFKMRSKCLISTVNRVNICIVLPISNVRGKMLLENGCFFDTQFFYTVYLLPLSSELQILGSPYRNQIRSPK